MPRTLTASPTRPCQPIRRGVSSPRRANHLRTWLPRGSGGSRRRSAPHPPAGIPRRAARKPSASNRGCRVPARKWGRETGKCASTRRGKRSGSRPSAAGIQPARADSALYGITMALFTIRPTSLQGASRQGRNVSTGFACTLKQGGALKERRQHGGLEAPRWWVGSPLCGLGKPRVGVPALSISQIHPKPARLPLSTKRECPLNKRAQANVVDDIPLARRGWIRLLRVFVPLWSEKRKNHQDTRTPRHTGKNALTQVSLADVSTERAFLHFLPASLTTSTVFVVPRKR